jgi:hypothetical protein
LIHLKEKNRVKNMIEMGNHISDCIDRLAISDQGIQMRLNLQQQLINYGPQVIPFLIPKLKSKNIWILSSLIEVLGDLRDVSIASHLIPFLDSQEVLIVRKTAIALAKIGDITAIPKIIELSADPLWHIKMSVAEALSMYYEHENLRELLIDLFLSAFMRDSAHEDFIYAKLAETDWDLREIKSNPGNQVYKILEKAKKQSINNLDWILLRHFQSIAVFLCEKILCDEKDTLNKKVISQIYNTLIKTQEILIPNEYKIII